MFEIAILACVIAAVLILLMSKVETKRHQQVAFPYVPRGKLYSKQERRFLGYLVRAVGERFFIMGKVRVADLVALSPGLSPANKRVAYEQICHESVDFVLTDRQHSSVAAAILLVESGVANVGQVARASRLDRVFQAAGIPLIRIVCRAEYRVNDIKAVVEASVSPLDTTKDELSPKVPSQTRAQSATRQSNKDASGRSYVLPTSRRSRKKGEAA